ncbi:DUF6366 family protein [Alkalihalobacillus sp. 1P02AB]|uniref:DUF6366 family protein n=1 Tax=Alkalihalobacillus sp. 1P02AB TaxID=3132260 RepID=UPI0039A6C413
MTKDQKTPAERRERLRQEELKRNPTGNLGDSFNRANSGSLADLTGSFGWKGFLVLIVLILIGLIVAYVMKGS